MPRALQLTTIRSLSPAQSVPKKELPDDLHHLAEHLVQTVQCSGCGKMVAICELVEHKTNHP